MNRTPAEYRRARHLERLAWLLDNSVRVPFTQRRVGLDSLIGLVPGIGDAVGGLLSTWILVQGVRLGASRVTTMRMILNVAVEVVVGFVPVFGDVFDMAWKANYRNVQLLRDHLEQPVATTRGSYVWLALSVAGLSLIGVATVWIGIELFRAVVRMVSALIGM